MRRSKASTLIRHQHRASARGSPKPHAATAKGKKPVNEGRGKRSSPTATELKSTPTADKTSPQATTVARTDDDDEVTRVANSRSPKRSPASPAVTGSAQNATATAKGKQCDRAAKKASHPATGLKSKVAREAASEAKSAEAKPAEAKPAEATTDADNESIKVARVIEAKATVQTAVEAGERASSGVPTPQSLRSSVTPVSLERDNVIDCALPPSTTSVDAPAREEDKYSEQTKQLREHIQSKNEKHPAATAGAPPEKQHDSLAADHG
jgi:hypothetical protein